MATLEEFETILKEVVNAKRLSASKMGRLTEIAMKNMESDTQLVSVLYRTHKSLPAAAKVASLYVFDALARAARHHCTKNNLSADSHTGNCASFLLKVESVVEGLFQDMIVIGTPEAKEKTKKILDIWVKGNTFPKSVLTRLTEVLKEKPEKVSVPEVKAVITSDPRTIPTTSVTPPMPAHSPVTPTSDPQAALLALLARAANTTLNPSVQTTTNTQLGVAQLAVLQHLAQAVSNPPSQAIHPVAGGTQNSHSSPSHQDSSLTGSIRHRSSDYYISSEKPVKDDRVIPKGNLRSEYRRGRGDRRQWGDRDRDRYWDSAEQNLSPQHRGGRSRSKSPPSRYGGKRNLNARSPRRSSNVPVFGQQMDETNAANVIQKDEFGRDIRPLSPDTEASSTPNNAPSQAVLQTSPDKSHIESTPLSSIHEPNSVSPVSTLIAANTSSNTSSAPFNSSTDSSQPGMDQFDLSMFDLTSPSSWEALGKMWQVTNGYLPTTEQLMQFVMTVGPVQSDQQFNSMQNPSSSLGQPRGNYRGRGISRGRSVFNGKDRSTEEGWAQPDDAMIINTVPEEVAASYDAKLLTPEHPTSGEGNNGSSGGRMQRIGDKWVFVRDPAGIS